MSLDIMKSINGIPCSCGKTHRFSADILTGSGVLSQLPDYIKKYRGSRVFVLSDKNTHAAAGQQVCSILEQAAIPHVSYVLPIDEVEPDEQSVGSVMMHYDVSCDFIVAVGSGVINDISKILSNISGHPYIIVGTAPSMDGYASASSSMTRDGLKISLSTRSADVIIGDTDILCQAPLKMMVSGLGDMIAKYVSICEWRLSQVITGEYYCETIADLIRGAVKRCTDHADGLLRKEPEAVQAVFEGLVIGGVAMNYAGISRPASGVEHYISHILDMRAAEFGTPADFHGIQCAIGTLIALRLYEAIRAITPDPEKARSYAAAFDYEAWSKTLRELLGKGAESMIQLERKEKKYDCSLHAARLETILKNWPALLQIMEEELPSAMVLESLLKRIGAPTTLSEIGIDTALLPTVFRATKDIRDKYVLSRLAWDLGVLDELL